MKARITIVLATAIAALTVAGGALAAPHQSTVRGWSHGSGGAKTWDMNRPGTVKPWAVKAWGIRSWDANRPATVKTWAVKGWARRPNPTCIRGAASAF